MVAGASEPFRCGPEMEIGVPLERFLDETSHRLRGAVEDTGMAVGFLFSSRFQNEDLQNRKGWHTNATRIRVHRRKYKHVIIPPLTRRPN